MTYQLAQFPLQIVVFPGETIPLHIFEPRYRLLISDCKNLNVPFGITPNIEGQMQNVGTSMELQQIKKRYPDGRLDILVHATHTFQIERFQETQDAKDYSNAEVIDRVFSNISDPTYEVHVHTLMQELYSIMRISKKKIPIQFELHHIAHKIGLSLREEYQLLCMANFIEQQIFVINRLEAILPQVREMEEIRKRIEMNGHTRFIIPPK